jgi:hypothetical protein
VQTQTTTLARTCARRGCASAVNKRTAKYCSRDCCRLDPERQERLRAQALRAGRRIVPMSYQLPMPFGGRPISYQEDSLARLGEGREDVPTGMSRFADLRGSAPRIPPPGRLGQG